MITSAVTTIASCSTSGSMVAGTARSMGLKVSGTKPF